jgi:hypothetical protein
MRRDRAAPRLEFGKARQLVGLQRQEPVQLLDQSACDRCGYPREWMFSSAFKSLVAGDFLLATQSFYPIHV